MFDVDADDLLSYICSQVLSDNASDIVHDYEQVDIMLAYSRSIKKKII